ncbi:hypothetical protein BOV94_09885 [Solemya velum gill symbiont]|nr:hypothetical protein BOV94_09885 [Solemya velum gill symbiont]
MTIWQFHLWRPWCSNIVILQKLILPEVRIENEPILLYDQAVLCINMILQMIENIVTILVKTGYFWTLAILNLSRQEPGGFMGDKLHCPEIDSTQTIHQGINGIGDIDRANRYQGYTREVKFFS